MKFILAIQVAQFEKDGSKQHFTDMLNHQVEGASYLAEIYGLSMKEESYNPLTKHHHQGKAEEDVPPETKQSLGDYANAMTYCREELFSILNDLDASVVKPADRFYTITRAIDKTIIKREHKLIDYDRYRITFMKYSAISEPSPSEEKDLFRLRAQYEKSASDYDYFSTILKGELAQFLHMFLGVDKFYNIQRRVFTVGCIRWLRATLQLFPL